MQLQQVEKLNKNRDLLANISNKTIKTYNSILEYTYFSIIIYRRFLYDNINSFVKNGTTY